MGWGGCWDGGTAAVIISGRLALEGGWAVGGGVGGAGEVLLNDRYNRLAKRPP